MDNATMSLCECPIDDCEWFFKKAGEPKPFKFKRRKRCLNCNDLININSECQELEILYYGKDGNPRHLVSKWLCEECNDLTLAIEELGGCYTLGGSSLKEQIIEANENE